MFARKYFISASKLINGFPGRKASISGVFEYRSILPEPVAALEAATTTVTLELSDIPGSPVHIDAFNRI